jgi:hypothetical protein
MRASQEVQPVMKDTGIESVALIGDFSQERVSIDAAAREYGFVVYRYPDLEAFEKDAQPAEAAAVMINAESAGFCWKAALKSVLRRFPGCRPIICHRFQHDEIWPLAYQLGAFYCLPMPLKDVELRMGLGFVWSGSHHSGEDRNMENAVPKRPPVSATISEFPSQRALAAERG